MWFDSIHSVLSIIAVGTLTFIFLIFAMRISGKRTLTQLNAFDFIVTITFGSTLSSTLLSKNVSMIDGMTALALLIVLQMITTYLNSRYDFFLKLIKAEPTLLMFNGEFLCDNIKAERLHRHEVLAALRTAGVADPSTVGAVILETSGEINVIQNPDGGEIKTLTMAGLHPYQKHKE